jgi:hypothetical protein
LWHRGRGRRRRYRSWCAFSAGQLAEIDRFFAFDPASFGGAFVAAR